MKDKTQPLSGDERVRKARKDYLNAQAKIYLRIKDKYGLGVEEMEAALEGWSEPGPVAEEWGIALERLQARIEKKYNVWIEHDDDNVEIGAWSQ